MSIQRLNTISNRDFPSFCFALAAWVGKVRLEKGNTPARPSLSEAARANMENFLEYIRMVLPALRIDCFPAQTRPQLKPVTASPANDKQKGAGQIMLDQAAVGFYRWLGYREIIAS